MKLTVVRAIPIVLAIALAAFFVSGVHRFKNAHHGLDAVVGEAAWLGFLIAALALIILVAVILHRRRRAAIVSACVCALSVAAVAGASTATVAPGNSLVTSWKDTSAMGLLPYFRVHCLIPV